MFRTIMPGARADFEFVESSGLLPPLVRAGTVIDSQRVPNSVLDDAAPGATIVIEHPRLPFVSYPYEWPFAALKAAALLHLDVHLEALANDVSLSDASAYNVQFQGSAPVFIDRLSFKRYREGEIWIGHRQFCEQFLNPLLLTSLLGIPYHDWYRGRVEGIPTEHLNNALPLRRKLSWRVFTHVTLHAKLTRGAATAKHESVPKVRPMSKPVLCQMLSGMRRWIEKLQPAHRGRTEWSDYAENTSYGASWEDRKRAFVAEFARAVRPAVLWDIGCNTGEYTQVALESGAIHAIGFDGDTGALQRAFERASRERLDFLPLYLDAANPAPSQGFAERERGGLMARGPADALLALALVHHLAIGRNVPLERLVDWLVQLAPRGVVEFVPKSDPMVQTLLRLREDVFDDYSEATFAAALERRSAIVRQETVSASGRRLYWYDVGHGQQ
ncbi:MAG: class I SAM-dependent methyltransferase [Gammaproteobacteria bacterium]